MNSSSHRIWSGSSGWPKPYDVAMRMKPSNATWVESRKTRPFWTLSTIRRPSRQPVHQGRERVVPEDEVGGLLGHPGPGAHRDRDVGTVQRRGVVHAVARDRHGPAQARGRSGRGAPSGRAWSARRPAGRRARTPADRRPSAASSSPTTTRSRSRPAAAAMAPAVSGWSPVTMMTSMPAIRAVVEGLADPIADRVGEADQARGPSTVRPRPAERPRPAARPRRPRASTRTDQRSVPSPVGIGERQDRLRRPDGELLDRAVVRACDCASVTSGRSSATGSLSTRSAGVEHRVPAGCLDGACAATP